jgi:SNF2 family DNA or RNA helicase
VELTPTTAMPLVLMDHQREGVSFLLDRHSGLLAFEQGLGKTLVAIEAFIRLREAGAVAGLVVLCPNSLKRNWAVEVARAAPALRTVIIGGPPKERRALLSDTPGDVFVINYETARNEIVAVQAVIRRCRAVLVLDESHYVKNMRSLNSIAARHFAPLTPYRWLLSGTPVPNAAADIYAQLHIVTGGHALGSFEAFVTRYAAADSIPTQREALAARISSFVLRRTKEQCLDLPDKTFVDVEVELPTWQRRLYDGLRDGLLREVEGMPAETFARFVPTALSRLLRLSQIASNPGLIMPEETRVPGKILELDRILDELVVANGRKVIIWSYYVATIELLTARYAPLGSAALYGATPVDDRQDIAQRFQTDPTLCVLVANPAAAGTGFTLTAATYAIYETLNWRYDLYAQSQDRNHRIGQHHPVTYIRLMAADTVEQAITEALARKAGVARGLLGDEAGEPALTNMTPEAFCEMLRTGHLPAQN